MEDAHVAFLQTIGASAENSVTRWTTFGNGAPSLQYEVEFAFNAVPIVGRGFWIVDRGRGIKVSVAYPQALSPESAAVASYFPATFGLFSH